MRCIRPLNASLAIDGSITYRQKSAIPGLIGFQFPCRKCLPCRLNIAREKAIRAVHEAQMHEGNAFITLTYSDEHLESPRLLKPHVQTFVKDLRNHLGNDPAHRISVMYTGEYGEETKRPHWHLLIFNYYPPDAKYRYSTKIGHKIYESKTIDEIWGRNDPKKKPSEIGTITMDSAGYVARYAAKKLVHGKDQDHDFHPIHQTSSKNALGKTWIEKYWKQTFDQGYIIIPSSKEKAGIPRYYVDWLKKHHPNEYIRYVTQKREETIKLAEANQRREELIYLSSMLNYKGGAQSPRTRNQVKLTILEHKFQSLQEKLKL